VRFNVRKSETPTKGTHLTWSDIFGAPAREWSEASAFRNGFQQIPFSLCNAGNINLRHSLFHCLVKLF